MYEKSPRKFRALTCIPAALEEGPDAGWWIWEYVSDQAIDTSAGMIVYGDVKDVLKQLERDGIIRKTGKWDNTHGKGRHWGTAVWELVDPEALLKLIERERRLQRTSTDHPDDWLNVRISHSNKAPADVWRELIRLVRNGTLEVMFVEGGEEFLEKVQDGEVEDLV